MLFARALLAFLILPGLVAGVLPWWIASADRGRGPGWPVLGGAVAVVGAIILLWCVRDFYVAGKGTLAPWDRRGASSWSASTASRVTRCTSAS